MGIQQKLKVWVTIILLGAAPQLQAAAVPSHLSSLASGLYQSLDTEFRQAASDRERGWAILQAQQVLRKYGVHRWAQSEITLPELANSISNLLKIDLNKPNEVEALNQFLSQVSETDTEEALDKLYILLERSPLSDDEKRQLSEQFTKLHSDFFSTMEKSHRLGDSEREPTVDLMWKPLDGDFQVLVKEPGSEFVEPYQARFRADALPYYDADKSLFSVKAKPAEQPVMPTLAEDLEYIDREIYGDWQTNEGHRWKITSPNKRNENDLPELDDALASRAARITALDEEISVLKASKVYLWQNLNTEEEVRQEKFRRLKEPWLYQGQVYRAENTEEEITRLEEERRTLAEQEIPLTHQHDPAGFNEAQQRGAEIITILVDEENGCRYSYDEAVISGNSIRARRTLVQQCDITKLPQTVIDQLLANWSPPEWIELEAEIDLASGELHVEGKKWRMHVTYGSMDYRVGSVHTPYSRTLTLFRPPRKAP
jgi:hypothetical protein